MSAEEGSPTSAHRETLRHRSAMVRGELGVRCRRADPRRAGSRPSRLDDFQIEDFRTALTLPSSLTRCAEPPRGSQTLWRQPASLSGSIAEHTRSRTLDRTVRARAVVQVGRTSSSTALTSTLAFTVQSPRQHAREPRATNPGRCPLLDAVLEPRFAAEFRVRLAAGDTRVYERRAVKAS